MIWVWFVIYIEGENEKSEEICSRIIVLFTFVWNVSAANVSRFSPNDLREMTSSKIEFKNVGASTKLIDLKSKLHFYLLNKLSVIQSFFPNPVFHHGLWYLDTSLYQLSTASFQLPFGLVGVPWNPLVYRFCPIQSKEHVTEPSCLNLHWFAQSCAPLANSLLHLSSFMSPACFPFNLVSFPSATLLKTRITRLVVT